MVTKMIGTLGNPLAKSVETDLLNPSLLQTSALCDTAKVI